MKNKTLQYILSSLQVVLLPVFLLNSCSTSGNKSSRQPNAVQNPFSSGDKIKVYSYKQELRTIEGHIIPFHFFQADSGAWFFALGCSKVKNNAHEFEIYLKPYQSPENLDAKVNTSLLKSSNEFETSEDCGRAFEKIQTATAAKPVCLQNSENGVLVTECTVATRASRHYRERF